MHKPIKFQGKIIKHVCLIIFHFLTSAMATTEHRNVGAYRGIETLCGNT